MARLETTEKLTEAREQLVDYRRRAAILIEDGNFIVLMTEKLIKETHELIIAMDDWSGWRQS